MPKRTVLVVAFLALATTLHAQAGPRRSGFHAAVGLGSGTAGVTCDDCDSDRESSLTFMFRFGGAIRPGVILAGEGTAWSKDYREGSATANATLTFVNFVTLWYPDAARGFFVKGGVGVASLKADVTIPGLGSSTLETNSAGLVLGAGWDIALSRKFSLTPYLDFNLGGEGDAKLNGGSTGGKLGGNVFHVGVSATWP